MREPSIPRRRKLAAAAAFFCALALLAAIPQALSAQVGAQSPAPAAAPGEALEKPAADSPALRLEEDDYHAGEAKPGTTISHEFVVYNDGGSDLVISDVIPSCGCSVATFPKRIGPGDSGIITLIVDLYAEWAGHDVNKMAVILSNDPSLPNTKITIRAKVLPEERAPAAGAPSSPAQP